jgi:kynurenine formamidase
MLLSQMDIVIIENLTNLGEIGGGLFTFAALPLRYKDADGSPIRAIAMIEE